MNWKHNLFVATSNHDVESAPSEEICQKLIVKVKSTIAPREYDILVQQLAATIPLFSCRLCASQARPADKRINSDRHSL